MTLYTAYGLQIDSEVPLPGLLPGSSRPADVKIRYGPVPNKLPDPIATGGYFQATHDAFLFGIQDVGRYLVVKGESITIDRFPVSHEDVLRTFLMGSAFGALMHQRRLLVMHASSIQTAHGAVLFVAPSGYGKSTLLAALVDQGYAMLSDDVTAIDMEAKPVPLAFPSFPRMRLSTEAAARIGREVASLPRVRYTDKHVVEVEHLYAEPLPVHAVYALGIHDAPDIQIESADAVQRFAIVRNNTYRYGFLESLGLRQVHFDAAARLARSVQVHQIKRPASLFLLGELVDRLSTALGEPVTATQEKEVG
jgi:hypothetical protein